jgi:hypothetical protein
MEIRLVSHPAHGLAQVITTDKGRVFCLNKMFCARQAKVLNPHPGHFLGLQRDKAYEVGSVAGRLT